MLEMVPGRTYKRSDLHAAFGGQQQGGISTPKNSRMVLLFTGEQGLQYGYEDHFHPDGTFRYTGEGQRGDMQMTKGNLAIQTHAERGKELHLFEYTRTREVRYSGRAEYLNDYSEARPDIDGNARLAIIFELLVESGKAGQPALPTKRDDVLPATFWKQPLEELREEVFASAENGETLPSTLAERKRIVYVRSARLKAYVIRRANGFCEGCCRPAPFLTRKNKPYFEPHHIRRVSDGGPDHPRWVIALCPNCHARVHHGIDGVDYNDQLAARMADIEPSRDG